MWFIRLFVSAVLFFGGCFLGLSLAGYLAEESTISKLLGFAMFPLAFITGMLLWQGVAIVTSFFKTISGGKKKADESAELKGKVPPGSFMLVPPAVIIPAIFGLAMGLLSEDYIIWWGDALICGAVGLGYGLVLWLTAKIKLLPMAES